MEILSKVQKNKYSKKDATFSTNIGYISKYKRWIEWQFNREKIEKKNVKVMLKLIHKYAIPFLETFVNIKTIQAGLNKYGFPGYKQQRNAIIEYLSGNTAKAINLVDEELTKLYPKIDDADNQFLTALKDIFKSSDLFNYYNQGENKYNY